MVRDAGLFLADAQRDGEPIERGPLASETLCGTGSSKIHLSVEPAGTDRFTCLKTPSSTTISGLSSADA